MSIPEAGPSGRSARLVRAFAFALSLAVPTLPTHAQLTVAGVATVTRPYAFQLEGYEVYLLGVDSVEVGQTCTVGRDSWECWAAAQRQLETILAEGEVSCEAVVGPDADTRMIAVCLVNGEDVGERFVRSGFGITIPSETDQYEAVQAEARANGAGLWQGIFTPPAVWRALPMRPPSLRPRFVPN
jgi:endonuclease YncB( thermonuclease family)